MARSQPPEKTLAILLIAAVVIIAMLQVIVTLTGSGNENVHNILSDAMDALRNTSFFFIARTAKK